MRVLPNESNMTMEAVMAEIAILRAENVQLREMIQGNSNEIVILRNEMTQMRSENNLRENEVRNLKKEIDDLKKENVDLMTELTVIINENKEQMNILRGENVEIRTMMSSLTDTITDVKITIEVREKETKCLIKELSQEIIMLKEENEFRKKEMAEIKDNNRMKWTDELEDNGDIQAREDVRIEDEAVSTSLRGSATAEGLHWTVTQLSQHHDQDRWSESFTISEYTMSVMMRWTEANNIWIKLYLMPETGVSWPMKQRLRLRLVESDSKTEIESVIINCDCEKLDLEKNCINDSINGLNLDARNGVKNSDSVFITVEAL